jgi:hypothetical protein
MVRGLVLMVLLVSVWVRANPVGVVGVILFHGMNWYGNFNTS